MSADKELSAILKKMKAGTADFQDMQRYSLRTAEIRAEVLKENLSPAGNEQIIGITAGASTPKNIIEEVQNYVRADF